MQMLTDIKLRATILRATTVIAAKFNQIFPWDGTPVFYTKI